MNLNTKKALGYVRISSSRQINNESPDTQRSTIQDYADRNGIEIIEWFFDEAKSGKNVDREELQNLLKFSLKYRGKIDHVIVYKMTRAGRDLESYIIGVKSILNSRGITIRSATEQIDETPHGRFMEGMLMLVGQLDNDTKASYTIDNMRSLAEQGYWQHPPLHGYDACKVQNERGKMRPSMRPNSMAPKVKAVLERFSEGDITKAELRRYSIDIGLRSRNGNILTDSSIKKLLETPEYAGYVHDKFTDYKLVEGVHEALISKYTYEKNLTILNRKDRSGEKHLRLNPLFPMKGLLLCVYCNRALYASSPRTGNGGHSPRYHCSRESCRGKAKSIRISVVHEQFEELLERIKPTDGILRLYKQILVREANQALKNLNKKVAIERSKLDSLAQKRTQAIQKFIDEQLTIEEKNEFIDEIDRQKIELTDNLRELEEQQSLREADIEMAINVMRNVNKQWSESDIDLKVRFQSMLFPDGVVYDFVNKRFGTTQLSPLYRCIPTQKGAEAPSNYNLVAGAGIAPATSWL